MGIRKYNVEFGSGSISLSAPEKVEVAKYLLRRIMESLRHHADERGLHLTDPAALWRM